MTRGRWILLVLTLCGLVLGHGERAAAQRATLGNPIQIIKMGNSDLSLRASDIDHDGDLDILWPLVEKNGYWCFFENDGRIRPGFTPRPLIPTTLGGKEYFDLRIWSVEDLYQDGAQEVIFSYEPYVNDAWMEKRHLTVAHVRWNAATATAGPVGVLCSFEESENEYSETRYAIDDVQVSDLDVDGLPDLVLNVRYIHSVDEFGEEYSTIYWIKNEGAKWSGLKQIYWGDRISSLNVKDIDRDGGPDLTFAVAEKLEDYGITYPRIVFLKNNKKGSYSYTGSTLYENFDQDYKSGSFWAEVIDMDHDADLDVVAHDSYYSDGGIGDLSFWIENKDQHFGSLTTHTLPVEFFNSSLNQWIDFNGDGLPDRLGWDDQSFVAADVNLGAPEFKFQRQTLTTAFAPNDIAAADLNRDQRPDLIMQRNSKSVGACLMNQGGWPPRFRMETLASPKLTRPRLSLGQPVDLNQDGFDDLSAWNVDNSAQALFWLPNNAGMTFTTHTLTSKAAGVEAVWPADVDRDGRMDVLAALGSQNKVALYRQTKPGRFEAVTVCGAEQNPVAVCAADLDRDGDLDVVSAAQAGNVIAWYETRPGAGGATPKFTRRLVSVMTKGASAVAAADLDKDGDVDILAASAGDNAVWWFENTGAKPPAFSAHKLTGAAKGACSVAAADLDGDGRLDVLSGSREDGAVRWFRNLGGRALKFEPIVIAMGVKGVRAVRAADLDGDGRQDVLASAPGSNDFVWFLNKGGSPAKFYKRRPLPGKALGARALATADLNGDGKLEVLAAAPGDGAVLKYQDGPERRVNYQRGALALGASGVLDVAAADLDGDGDQDVIGAAAGAGRIEWYENPAR